MSSMETNTNCADSVCAQCFFTDVCGINFAIQLHTPRGCTLVLHFNVTENYCEYL